MAPARWLMWISPVPSCARACAAALVLFGAPFISSCRPSLDAEGPAAQRDGAVDFAARQAAALQRNDGVAGAYRKEHAGALPSNADEVIARHLGAVGGREALDTVQTMVVRLSVHGTAGRVGGLIRYYRKPLFYRQHMSSDASALVTDGRRAWSVGPDGWEEREGGVASLLPMASMDEHLMAPEEAGLTHELLGVVAMDADPGFQVRRVWP